MYRFRDIEADAGVTTFSVDEPSGTTIRLTSPLRGRHNVANVTGAVALARRFGVGSEAIREAVADFGGVDRRFDIVGTADGATFVDDYAHLPREIAAVLAAARTSGDGWSRVIAVFQPNRYNRMSVMSPEYADAFVDADVVVLTDIYASGTRPIEGVTGRLVVEAVLARHPDTRLEWVPSRSDLAQAVDRLVRPGDVCISMGCGDIESLPREILALRSAR
jgi:UDP-N-acetylmuramate--alanine ligase